MSQTTSTNNNYDTVNINTPTMPFYDFENKYDTLCIQATTGMGKTNTLYDYLKCNINYTHHSVLIVSFRRSLCKKYAEDLPVCQYYENIKEYAIDNTKYPFLICQVDSIKRIRGHYDLVIFDELCSTASHLINYVEQKKRCFDMFRNIMNDNNKIIILDALLNSDWLDYISKFDRKCKYIKNEYTIHSKKTVLNYGTNATGFINEIKKSIENKQKIVIATNNKKMLKFIENIIENHYPRCKKLMIKKETKSMYNTNEWKNVQVLGYTPSIVAGVSFTEKHFDKYFGLFCNSSSTADMAFQQMFRVRDVSTGEYHICCEVTGKKDYPVSDDEIKKMVLNEDKCLISGLDNVSIDYIKKDIVEDEYFSLFLLIQKNIFKCKNDYNGTLINIFKTQGFSKIINKNNVNVNDKKIFLMQKREFNKNVKEEEAQRIENAIECNEEEIQEIKDKKERTEEEEYILKKDSLQKRLKIKRVTKEQVLKFGKKSKQLWNNAYIYAYSDFDKQLIKRINYDEKHIDVRADISTRLKRDRKYERMLLCNHFLKNIGFNNPLDTNTVKINKNKIKDYICKYKHIIEAYFECNSFDIEIFKTDKWYPVAKRYMNTKLMSVYNISIIDDRKNNQWYIKGLDFWDETVTYKNVEILNEIKENEKVLFKKIDEKYEEYLQDQAIDEKINNKIKSGLDEIDAVLAVLLEEKDEEKEGDYNSNETVEIMERKKTAHTTIRGCDNTKINKMCTKCNKRETLSGDKCVACKFSRF